MPSLVPAEPPPAMPAPARTWHPLLRTLLYLVAYVLIQAVAVMVVGIAVYALDDRFFEDGGLGRSREVAAMAVVLLCIPPVLAVTWLFVRFLDRRTLASIGVRWPSGGRQAALRQAVTIPLGTLALVTAWFVLILALPPDLATVRFGGVSEAFLRGPAWWPASPSLLLALFLPLFLLQGGLEEWVLRGYVYHALKERWRPWVAALASSVLFSLFHATNPDVDALALLNIVLAGVVLAALVERSGSLWSATLAHGVWNYSLACLLSVPVSGVEIFHLLDLAITGDERLTGGGFGPEGSLALTALGLPLAILLWRRTGRRPPATGPRLLEEMAPSTREDAASPLPEGERMAQNLQTPG